MICIWSLESLVRRSLQRKIRMLVASLDQMRTSSAGPPNYPGHQESILGKIMGLSQVINALSYSNPSYEPKPDFVKLVAKSPRLCLEERTPESPNEALCAKGRRPPQSLRLAAPATAECRPCPIYGFGVSGLIKAALALIQGTLKG